MMIRNVYCAFTLACCLLFIHFTTFAQQVSLSDQLKKSIDESLEIRLLPALDALVIQISENNVRDSILWKKEAKFTKAIFEDAHRYELSYRDSLSVISRALLNCYPIGEGLFSF